MLKQKLYSKRLPEKEKLIPCDSKCNHKYIKKIDILSNNVKVDENGERYKEVRQLVTYIDDSMKEFKINIYLKPLETKESSKKLVMHL